mgnify:CR=1 FL=1
MNIILDKRVDVVLIAGDVYDKGIPNIEAVRLFSDFLASLYNFPSCIFYFLLLLYRHKEEHLRKVNTLKAHRIQSLLHKLHANA